MGWAVVWFIALAGGMAFLLATLWGDFSWAARLGGAAWVAFLLLIILSAIIPPRLAQRRHSGR